MHFILCAKQCWTITWHFSKNSKMWPVFVFSPVCFDRKPQHSDRLLYWRWSLLMRFALTSPPSVSYTILSVKQERIVEELDEEARIHIIRGPWTGANSWSGAQLGKHADPSHIHFSFYTFYSTDCIKSADKCLVSPILNINKKKC